MEVMCFLFISVPEVRANPETHAAAVEERYPDDCRSLALSHLLHAIPQRGVGARHVVHPPRTVDHPHAAQKVALTFNNHFF